MARGSAPQPQRQHAAAARRGAAGHHGQQPAGRRRSAVAGLLAAVQGRFETPAQGRGRGPADRPDRRLLRPAGRVSGAQPPGRDFSLRLAPVGARRGRATGRCAGGLAAAQRAPRPAGAHRGALDGRPGSAQHDRGRRPRQRPVATHRQSQEQPLPDAGHAEPRLARGGALADRPQPDTDQAHAARRSAQHGPDHRHRERLSGPAGAAAVRPHWRRLRRPRPVGEPARAARRALAVRRGTGAARCPRHVGLPRRRHAGPAAHAVRGRLSEGDRGRLPRGRSGRPPAPGRHKTPAVHCHRRGRRHGDLGLRPPARRAHLVRGGHRPRCPVRTEKRLPGVP